MSSNKSAAESEAAKAPTSLIKPTTTGSTAEYLTKQQTAALLRVTPRTLENWAVQGKLPYYKIGRTVRYSADDIRSHLDRHCRVGGAALN